ncbi:hypothetical protein P8452_41058 [Trifolium repens]|nr:hypothetical protein P8452_41058 [Trifolium repens]
MASNLVAILTGVQKGWFTTFHIASQDAGEVDPFFVASFHEELPTDWEIYDGSGVGNNIEFNCLANHPLLTTGWLNLRSHFSWPAIQKLSFFYYGGNKFFMLIDNNSNSPIPSSFPSFHTLNHLTNNNRKFRMRITTEHITATTMTIRQDLDIFLTATRHSLIKLCGPLNNVVIIHLIRSSNSSIRLKFGNGWTNFCSLNQIVDGTVLQFEKLPVQGSILTYFSSKLFEV